MLLEGTLGRSLREGRRAAGGRHGRWRVLVSALVLLLGAGGGREATAAENVPAFSYEQYCDAQGHFTYDGAALKLVKQPAHLAQVYEDAGRGDTRAKELVRELEYWFQQAGVVVADTTTRPACLLPKELTPACQPNWQFLKELLGDTREADRLRQVVVKAYEERARARGLQNQVIMAGVNLLLAGGMVQGVVTQATAAEARTAAGQALAAEAKAAQAAARAAGQSGVAAKGPAGLLQAGKAADHHLLPRQFEKFFAERRIDIHKYTVTLPEATHLKGVHGRGLGDLPGRWNQRWADFIKNNPNATAKDVYQQLGRMADEFGLSNMPIHPYKQGAP